MVRGLRGVIGGVLALAMQGGCAVAPPAWTTRPLGAGQPRVLTTAGVDLLYGWSDAAGPHLALVTESPDGQVAAREVPLQPGTPYGRVTDWVSIVTDGTRVTAVGGAAGGAHGNTRWTVWSGTGAGLVEQPQEFEAFGGWDAGGVRGLGLLDGEPVLVGSWRGAAGLDVTTWHPVGVAWLRDDSAGTPLAATATELPEATGVSGVPGALVVSGTVTRLQGGVRVRPAVWVGRPEGDALVWERTDPAALDGTRAETVGCAGAGCLVVGRSAGNMVAWAWASGSALPVGLPPVDLAENDVVLPPVATPDGSWVVAVHRPQGPSPVLARSGDAWRALPAPPVPPLAVTTHVDHVDLVGILEGAPVLVSLDPAPRGP